MPFLEPMSFNFVNNSAGESFSSLTAIGSPFSNSMENSSPESGASSIDLVLRHILSGGTEVISSKIPPS